jgi:ElaB/YqjD/DUF883 family membrane-anchored ribosome-binding protein
MGCHSVSLISSAAGDLSDPPEDIVEALRITAGNLDIGHRYEEVTIFLTPGRANPSNAGFARTSDAWVTQSDFIDRRVSHTRIILHEYIHTRQAYNQASIGGMSWVIEGSAEYLSYKMALKTDAISVEAYNKWLTNGSTGDDILTNRLSWDSDFAPYERGGVYMAALDSRIQASSNNSIESLFRHINAIGGDESNVLVQRHIFLDIVTNVSTAEVRNWANTTMDSSRKFNISSAMAETDTNSVIDDLAEKFESRVSAKPYGGFAVALSIGIVIGMFPYEWKRSKRKESKDEKGDSGE